MLSYPKCSSPPENSSRPETPDQIYFKLTVCFSGSCADPAHIGAQAPLAIGDIGEFKPAILAGYGFGLTVGLIV